MWRGLIATLLLCCACSSQLRVNDYTDGAKKAPGTFRAAVLHLGSTQGSRKTKAHALRDVEENTKKAHELIRLAAARGAEIVITPEYGNTGNLISAERRDWLGTALPSTPSKTPLFELELDGLQKYVVDYARLAAELDIWIVTGVLERVEGEERNEYYNVGLVLDNRGRVRARYRKINLWRFTEGQLDAGTEPTTFDTPFGRFGMLICSDALYPSLWDELVDDNSDYLIMQSHWTPSPYVGWIAMGRVADGSERTVLWSNHPSKLGAGGAGFIHPGVANDEGMSLFSGPGIVITDLPIPERIQTVKLP